MVYYHGIRRTYGILIGILVGVVLLMLYVSGAAIAAPSTNITISLTTTPQPPTDMEITQTGVTTANITWIKGLAANITIIRVATAGYPFSIFDGSAVYSGNGTSVMVSDLDLENNTYYYRAWSQNAYGTSTGYDQVSIGNGAKTSTMDASALIAYLQELFGGPMGIGNIVFIIALLGFAIWKRGWIRIILSLGVIIWGSFSVQYDPKIAGPLLGIGVVLFLEGILRMIKQSREEQQEV